MSKTTEEYIVLSPDGIPIRPHGFPSVKAAEKSLELWMKGYLRQGYYHTAQGERIPLNQLRDRCKIERV